jgi:hypothetical protein
MPVTLYPRSSDSCEECTVAVSELLFFENEKIEALKLLMYPCHTKAIALALSPPEYAKNMHANLDEVCSGIDVPARTASLETSEEESSWIASLVCAEN